MILEITLGIFVILSLALSYAVYNLLVKQEQLEDWVEDYIDKINEVFKKIDSFNLPYGIAGSLDKSNSKVIKQIRPFWAGYRGGVCNGDRKGDLSENKIRLIKKSLKIV